MKELKNLESEVRRLKAALRSIVDYSVFTDECDELKEARVAVDEACKRAGGCEECTRNKSSKYHPTSPCNKHYCEIERAREHLERAEKVREYYVPRDIARKALEASSEGKGNEN